MSAAESGSASALSLVVRRRIEATVERVFAAWTEPDQLKRWWGPAQVTCTDAQVDLRPGGRYRIANRFPDGRVVWIAGAFETVEPPRRLVYSWSIEGDVRAPERVTVRFKARGSATEVIVTHDRIPDAAMRDQHAEGWAGCLDGLAAHLDAA